MTIYRKAGNSWTTIRNIYRKSGNVWTSVENVYRKAGGVWNSVFLRNNSPVIRTRVTIASDVSYIGDGQFATLTGRNYSWTPTSGLTLTYRFEKSTTIDFASVTLISSGNISNPASGSSNTVTQSVYPAAFSQTDMYFRFKVTAVNSSGTTVSVSDVIAISYYGTPVPQSPYPEITGSTTVGSNAFGNIGVWTNSPTSYSYRWFFNSGLSSYPLTFSQSRSVTNKSLSGLTATLTTSAPHGYKASDVAIITSMDNSLFNKSSATISSVTNSTITYTITSPAAWADAGTPYTVGQYVLYSGNVYSASSTISSSSPYNGGTLYSSGAIVYSGTNRYQSNLNNNIGNAVTNPIYWSPLGNFAPGGSLWTIQNFSNASASGTITAPNYYEGTSDFSTSFLLTTPQTDYKTSIDLRGQVLGFGVKAYNPATNSPSEYIGTKFIYGYPSITIGSITTTATTASIPYTHSYMTEYDIDIRYAGTSISTYPRTVTSPSSPISITGLTNAPRTYSYSITPKNGEGTAGSTATGTFTTISAPTISGISVSDTTPFPSSATSISVSNTAPSNTGSVSWVNNANTSVAGLFTVSGAGSGGSSPTNPSSLLTSGTFTVGSTGTANVGIRSINTFTSVHATWTQTGAQSYSISYDIAGVPGNPQTAIGNSSASNPSAVLLQNSSATVTLRSITVYPNINQGGTGVTLTSTASATGASKITDTSGSGSVTYTAPSTPPTGGSVSVDPTTGTADTTQFTATPASWSGTTPITYSYSWQWMNSSFAWTSVATGSTFTPTVVQNSSAIAWRVVLTASNGISPNGSATASFSVNNPAVIPTITMGSNTGVTSSAGTINWTSTNQNSYSSNGTFTSTGGSTVRSISASGLSASTTYTGTVTVTSSTGNTASANYSLTTTAAPLNPVVWGAMTAPTFARNTTPASSSTSYRWGWNNQLPTSGDYTASDITWEWQHSTSNATTTQSATPIGLIASGTRPNRSTGGLTVGSSTFNNRVSSLSGDYNTGNPAQPTVPINNEPVTFSTSSRYLRYRAVVVGTNGTTYRSNYSAWV